MHGYAGGGLELLPVDCGEDADVIVGSSSRCNQTMTLIDHLDEVADGERDCLDSFEFFLGPDLLSFEFDLIILDVFFLDVQVLQLLVQFLQPFIQIILLCPFGGLDSGGVYQHFSFHHGI